MTKNIFFLTEEIQHAGGIARVVNIWANYFGQKKDFDVTVVATSIENPFFKYKEVVNIRAWKFYYINKIFNLPFNIISTFFFLKSLNNLDDVTLIIDRAIHVEPIWLLRKFGLYKKMNIVYFFHGGSSDFRKFYMNRLPTRFKVGMVFKAFDKAICLFDDEKDYPKLVDKNKLHFINNPVPFEFDKTHVKKETGNVLFLGRVTKEKGVDTLIKSWAAIEKKFPQWRLSIVGEGKDKEEFKLFVKNRNLNQVDFFDSTPNVVSEYEKADILVLPSLWEGMPMVILEAMAKYVTVISSDTFGGRKLIKNNNTGLLFPIGNESKLKESLETLIEDKLVRNVLSVNARTYVEQYHINNAAKQWEPIFNVQKSVK